MSVASLPPKKLKKNLFYKRARGEGLPTIEKTTQELVDDQTDQQTDHEGDVNRKIKLGQISSRRTIAEANG